MTVLGICKETEVETWVEEEEDERRGGEGRRGKGGRQLPRDLVQSLCPCQREPSTSEI